mmetsp:Transcript_33092/g.70708  ORF Transcript_33092/g.70708 Transcript_33092/m.70708 type:complete len:224 (+) Transcript_33092:195-866(+)
MANSAPHAARSFFIRKGSCSRFSSHSLPRTGSLTAEASGASPRFERVRIASSGGLNARGRSDPRPPHPLWDCGSGPLFGLRLTLRRFGTGAGRTAACTAACIGALTHAACWSSHADQRDASWPSQQPPRSSHMAALALASSAVGVGGAERLELRRDARILREEYRSLDARSFDADFHHGGGGGGGGGSAAYMTLASSMAARSLARCLSRVFHPSWTPSNHERT